jgi:hypothetical protein
MKLKTILDQASPVTIDDLDRVANDIGPLPQAVVEYFSGIKWGYSSEEEVNRAKSRAH